MITIVNEKISDIVAVDTKINASGFINVRKHDDRNGIKGKCYEVSLRNGHVSDFKPKRTMTKPTTETPTETPTRALSNRTKQIFALTIIGSFGILSSSLLMFHRSFLPPESPIRHSRKLSSYKTQLITAKGRPLTVRDVPPGPPMPELGGVPENLRICFFGDSITRYQYLDLIYFLHTGEWYDAPPSIRLMNYLTRSWSWGITYNEFFEGTTAIFQGKENCDCRRETKDQEEIAADLLRTGRATVNHPKNTKVNFPRATQPTHWFENRYYYDPVKNNSISFIQAFGDYGSQSHWEPHTVFRERKPPITEDGLPVAFKGNWSGTIANFIAKMDPKPDVLVFNSGRWPSHMFASNSNLDAMMKACEEANITAIWKTTTQSRDMYYYVEEYEERLCTELPCLNVSWTLWLPDTAQWDPVHYWNPYYTTMNKQLMELMVQIGVMPSQRFAPVLLPIQTDTPTAAPTMVPTPEAVAHQTILERQSQRMKKWDEERKEQARQERKRKVVEEKIQVQAQR